jgi:hypothetical protein
MDSTLSWVDLENSAWLVREKKTCALKIRRIVENLLKGQKLQKSIMYASVKNGGLEQSYLVDEYYAYKVHHFADLMRSDEGLKILNWYLKMNKLPKFQDLINTLEIALNSLRIKWLDRENFKEN